MWVHLHADFIVNVLFLLYDFLNDFFFSPAYFTVMLHITGKMSVIRLFILSVRLLTNSREFIDKFSGSQKLHMDFQLFRRWVPQTFASFKTLTPTIIPVLQPLPYKRGKLPNLFISLILYWYQNQRYIRKRKYRLKSLMNIVTQVFNKI